MKYILTVIIYILTLAEYFAIYYILFHKNVQVKKGFRRGLFCPVGIILGCGVIFNWSTGVWLLPLFLCSFFVMYLLFDVSMKENIKVWPLSFAGLCVVETVINYILMVLFTMEESLRIIIYITCIIVGLWIYYITFGRRWDRTMFALPGKILGLVVGIMVLIVGMISYFSFVLTLIPKGNLQKTGIVVLFAGGFAICMMLFSLLYYFNSKQKLEFQNQMQEKYNEQQRVYFLEMLQKEEDTRRFRHDMIGDLLELQNYIENKEEKKIKAYLSEMLGEMQAIGRRQYDVGNEIVNTILNYYLQPLKDRCQIKVKGRIQEETGISQRDLCGLISNLVKNAVEAVADCKESEREVLVSVSQGEAYMYFSVENTISREICFGKDGMPKTTKEDKANHGFGLRNVRNIVEKYQGRYETKVDKHKYMVEVYLKMK